MQLLRIIQYFFYIGFNWNFRIAAHTLYYELWGERRYNINTSGYKGLLQLVSKNTDVSHSTQYMPVSYYLLEKIFKELSVLKIDHFIDIGCG